MQPHPPQLCLSCRRDMSPAARDRAFKAEMRAEGNLHPALQTPDGHYKVRLLLCTIFEECIAGLLHATPSTPLIRRREHPPCIPPACSSCGRSARGRWRSWWMWRT